MNKPKLQNVPTRWVTGLPPFPDLRLRVRGLKATGFEAEVARRCGRMSVQFLYSLPKSERERNVHAVMIAVIVDRVLLDWDQLIDDEGNGDFIDFQPEVARKLLAELPALLRMVIVAASRVEDNDLPGILE